VASRKKSNAITYTACYVWSAFQTGNTIQCAMAIAKLFTKYPHPVTENPWPDTVPEQVSWNPLAAAQWDWRRDTGLRTSDAQALASLLCFLFGAFCGRLGDHIGPRKRAWLVSNTFLQAMFTLGATLCCHANGKSRVYQIRGIV
jgi:MFS family permease